MFEKEMKFWSDYVVHIPLPTAFSDAKAKAEMLVGVQYLLLVGSLMRPRKLAKVAQEQFGMKHVGCYFNVVEDYAIADREYNVEVVDLGRADGAKMAIVSHGIGGSGAEIVIKEMRALVHWCHAFLGRDGAQIRVVGRSGTRGTIGDVAYGSVGISVASYDDNFHVALPDPALTERLAGLARSMDMPVALGSGVATNLFWEGQGRAVPAEGRVPEHLVKEREAEAQRKLWGFVNMGIVFAEMEDYTVHKVCREMGIRSVSAGAVIARRFDSERGEFIIDYCPEAKEKSELMPARAIIKLFSEV